MTLQKRIGLGTTIGVDPAGSTTYTALGGVVNISGPDAKATDCNTALLGDVFATFEKGEVDGGSMQIEIAYDPADTTSHTLSALLASTSLTLPHWQITFADAGTGTVTETFFGYVNGISRPIEKNKMIMCTVSIKVSGDPGYKQS